jgi:hypothetical protein
MAIWVRRHEAIDGLVHHSGCGVINPFVQILTGSKLIAAFGDDTTALIMYDTETVRVKSAPGAECVTVKDGKITDSRFVFDGAPFDAARNAAS